MFKKNITKAKEAKKEKIKSAIVQAKNGEQTYRWYYNALTGRRYSLRNQEFLYAQGIKVWPVVAKSAIICYNSETKKNERKRNIRKGCSFGSVQLACFSGWNDTEVIPWVIVEKWEFRGVKFGSVLSVYDLLLEDKRELTEKDIVQFFPWVLEELNVQDNTEKIFSKIDKIHPFDYTSL